MKIEKESFLYWIGGFFVIILIWQFGVVSVGRKLRELEGKIAGKEEALKEIKSLSEEYLQIKKTEGQMRKSLDNRERDYTPLSFLERLSRDAGVRYELTYQEPRELKDEEGYMESSVGVELSGLNIKKLINYLYQVENSSELLLIRNLHLRTGKDGLLKVSFEVSTPVPSKG